MTDSDVKVVYDELVSDFYKLHPSKTGSVNVTAKEIDELCINFVEKVKSHQQFSKLLIKRDPRLFKAMKIILIPKIKMEVILNKLADMEDEKKIIIDKLWLDVWMLYILIDAKTENPDEMTISTLKLAIDCVSSEGSRAMKEQESLELNQEQIAQAMQMMGMEGQDISKMATMVKSMTENIKYTDKSKTFADDIVNDIKSKAVLAEKDGKVDSKEFVNKLLSLDETVNKYKVKLETGEIAMDDMLGVLANMMSGDDTTVSNISEALQLDKVDLNEVMSELKEHMDGKLPPELAGLVGELDAEKLKNLDIGNVVGQMMGGVGKQEEVKELTEEERQEMLEFYKSFGEDSS